MCKQAPYNLGDLTLAGEAWALIVRKLRTKTALLQVTLLERHLCEGLLSVAYLKMQETLLIYASDRSAQQRMPLHTGIFQIHFRVQLEFDKQAVSGGHLPWKVLHPLTFISFDAVITQQFKPFQGQTFPHVRFAGVHPTRAQQSLHRIWRCRQLVVLHVRPVIHLFILLLPVCHQSPQDDVSIVIYENTMGLS